MTVLDRNFGTFNSTTSVTVTRSTGSFGTGTVIVVLIFGNTTFTTPSGWTQRHNSVANLGLYAYDRTGAGEASFGFTAGAAGSGQWHVWELSAGSTYVTGGLFQEGSSSTTALPGITPTAGNRHLLAVAGGTNSGASLSVTAFTNSFVLGAGGQATGQDRPFSYKGERDVTADGTTSYGTTATFSAATVGAAGGGILAYINNAGDTTAPTVPTGLQTTAVGSTTATLSWTASTDDVGVTGYELQVTGP